MKASHLGRAVAFLCSQLHLTQTELAHRSKISQAALSRACSGTRLENNNLRALCTGQPDSRDGLELLLGHLRDEIERAGHSTAEVQISAAALDLDDDLRALLEATRTDPQLDTLLRQIAGYVRTHPITD